MRDVQLASERLWLRRPDERDLPILEQLFCDPAVMHYLGEVWTRAKVADALLEWREAWGTDNRWYGVLLRKDTGEVIGTAGFTENTLEDEAGLELSWFVLPSHQGNGFAGEITRELLRFAFADLGKERVVAETHPDNPSSNRVLERAGFTCLGERRHHYEYLPGFDIQVLWELTREHWHSSRATGDLVGDV